MPAPARTIQALVWGGLLLVVGGVVAAFVFAPPLGKPLIDYGVVPDFSLSDQDGRVVSLNDFRGKVWVADLIFSRCPDQCPLMSSTMKQLQAVLPLDPPVRLVSITSDPGYDTPGILKKYGQRYDARDGVWFFLTGPKSMIHHLAVMGLKLSMADKKPSEQESPDDLIVHSTKLVLIDSHGHIRGYYKGETPDCIPGLLSDIQTLARER